MLLMDSYLKYVFVTLWDCGGRSGQAPIFMVGMNAGPFALVSFYS